MTREKAIEYLKCADITVGQKIKTKTAEALDLAINALQTEPCEDAISRSELLKAIDTWDRFGVDDTNSLFRLDNLSLPHYIPYIHYDDVVKCIKGMPSVQPTACIAKISFDDQQMKEMVDKAISNLDFSDFISIQAVLDVIEREEFKGDAISEIEKLPSVQPERKTGKWIKYGVPRCGEQHYQCTACDWYVNFGVWGDVYTKQFKFCPNCGAKMVEPKESEDKE